MLDHQVDGRFWARLGRCLFAPWCRLCGAAGAGGRDLCAACAAALPRNRLACGRCALPLAVPAEACGQCLKRPPAFDASRAPFRYAYPLDRLVQRFKFGGDLAAGTLLTQLLADHLQSFASAIDLIVPVPLHRQRLRERGFNQALELARPLARRLDLPLDYLALQRTRSTSAQTGLDAVDRRRNVRQAFAVAGNVRGLRVALLDDVVTTGATVRECARVLKAAGAARVEVWALARAPNGRI